MGNEKKKQRNKKNVFSNNSGSEVLELLCSVQPIHKNEKVVDSFNKLVSTLKQLEIRAPKSGYVLEGGDSVDNEITGFSVSPRTSSFLGFEHKKDEKVD
jgi:hypothetical protein